MNQYTNENPYTEEFYLENLRKMSPEKRLKISFQLRDLSVTLCKDGIKQQNPGLDEKGIEKELFRRLGYDATRYIYKSNSSDK